MKRKGTHVGQMNLLEPNTRQTIADKVYDQTVGSGNSDPYPTPQQLESISAKLGRPLTAEDRRAIREEWDYCLQMMGQP